MLHKQPFKVVIVGGSIAGLSLANMLQANGIDYILLEAYRDIAPQVGASIGLHPSGLRILDQLGLFEKILHLAPPAERFSFRNQKGQEIASYAGMTRTMIERHGYPVLFLDRQMVLQVLFENIKDKSKILTGKRVTQVEMLDNGVKATVTDGTTYQGDILVGADGIHSTVRQQMWNIADKLSPGYIATSEKSAVSCDYGCIFGISKPCKGIEPGNLNSVFRNKTSYLVNGGPNSRVYWFLYFKLPNRVYGADIPVYTKADEARVFLEHENDNILPDLKFGDLVKQRTSSTITPLAECVYKKWHFGRIIMIGDAAHKFNPIAGLGGNSCIEDAATLTNALVKALHIAPRLNSTEISTIFSRVQSIREKRAKANMQASHNQQRVEAMETPFHKFLAQFVLPLTDTEDILGDFSSHIPACEKLDGIPLPLQPKLIPFKDELAIPPKSRGSVGWFLMSFYLASSLLVYYGMWIRSADYGLNDHFGAVMTTGTFPDDPNFPLKRVYTRIGFIDNYLAFLSAAYMPGLAGWDKSFGTLQMYFLGMLTSPIAIWSIESCRKRNSLTLLALPTIWYTLVQWGGVGIWMPLYYIAYTWISDKESYWWPLSRHVPAHYAKSLLPAILIGYVVPTILMFMPWKDPATIQIFEALWQPSPIFCTLLTVLFAAIYNRWYPIINHQTPSASAEPSDLRDLKRIYIITGVLSAILHFAIMSQLLVSTDPNHTLHSVFVPDFRSESKSLGEGMRALFRADFWGFYLASYVWCCSAVWDLKRVGRTNADLGKTFVAVLVANFLVGPGGAMAGVWYWREIAMARTSLSRRKM